MIEKYFQGKVPVASSQSAEELTRGLISLIETAPSEVDKAMAKPAFSDALAAIWNLVSNANVYIEKQAPWALAKKGENDQLALVMSTLIKALKVVADQIAPFMPETSKKVLAQLNLGGEKVAKGDPLFPRVQK
jgi:methionyl-tRNA synthetase